MNKYCEYCSHSADDSFNCLPCIHLDNRPYADNTVVLEVLFIASPSKIFAKGTPEGLKKGLKEEE